MFLLVGLGNPGAEYARQRHNVGFMALERIAAAHGFGPWRRRFQGVAADGALAGRRTLLLRPLTYVNESGRAVAQAARFFKLEAAAIAVFHDDIDLAPGKLRARAGGGHAGHNGIRSIHAHLGPDYRRVRIGIGHPGHKERVQPHVLGNFSPAETPWLDALLEAIAAAAPLLAQGGDDRFQSRVALLAPPPGGPGKGGPGH